MIGAPDASAMPSDSGMAMRKTTRDARTSCRGAENRPGRATCEVLCEALGMGMGRFTMPAGQRPGMRDLIGLT